MEWDITWALGFWDSRWAPVRSQLSFYLRTEAFSPSSPVAEPSKMPGPKMDRPVAWDLLARKPVEAGLKTSPKRCYGKKVVNLIQKFKLEVKILPVKREISLLTSLIVSTVMIFLKCTIDHATPLLKIFQ